MTLSDEAITYVKTNRNRLVAEYCELSKYVPIQTPMSFFMAGSPGSGKTEYSSKFTSSWEEKHPESRILRLDVDELRKLIPGYNGTNSDDIQKACTILLDKIQDYALANGQSMFMDGTFSSPKSIENVKRHISHHRTVGIVYLYQDPLVAWEYTKKRERLEGRTVPKEVFVRAYFESRENVNEVKRAFGDKVHLDLVIKNRDNSFSNTEFNIQNVDSYLKPESFTSETLIQSLPDSLD